MKFLILALVVVSLGLSECLDSLHIPKRGYYTAKEVLKVFFNITNKELNAECDKVDTDEKTRWDKIDQALSDLQIAATPTQEDPNPTKDDDFTAETNVIKTALPCATDDQVSGFLDFYKQVPKPEYQSE